MNFFPKALQSQLPSSEKRALVAILSIPPQQLCSLTTPLLSKQNPSLSRIGRDRLEKNSSVSERKALIFGEISLCVSNTELCESGIGMNVTR